MRGAMGCPAAEQFEPFGFGKALTGRPEVGEHAADKVERRLFFLRVFAVEVRLPATDDAQEELFRVTGLKVVPDLVGQLFETAELAEFLQQRAEKERVLSRGQ